jgi:hypothetical protein
MKKKNKLYMTIIVTVVIILLLLTTIPIFNNKVMQIMNISNAYSQEDFNGKLVTRNISPEILRIKSFLPNTKLPENIETVSFIKKTIEDALNAWAECQDLVNSKKIRMEYKIGELILTTYEDPTNNIHFRIFLQSENGKIGQCKKNILPSVENSEKQEKTLYIINFNAEFNIERYKDENKTVCFYPSGLIESILYDTQDGMRHYLKWSEDGNIIVKNNYDKSQRNPLIVEAEEKTQKLVDEMQERYRKEMEEYLKNQKP